MSFTAEIAAAPSPRQTTTVFAAAIGRGDLELASRCFTNDACLITPDATAIRGRGEIRPILAQIIARKTRIASPGPPAAAPPLIF